MYVHELAISHLSRARVVVLDDAAAVGVPFFLFLGKDVGVHDVTGLGGRTGGRGEVEVKVGWWKRRDDCNVEGSE